MDAQKTINMSVTGRRRKLLAQLRPCRFRRSQPNVTGETGDGF
jgi:hypothetical protein